VARETIRAPFRLAATGADVINGQSIASFTPGNRVEKFFLGDKPIRNSYTEGREFISGFDKTEGGDSAVEKLAKTSGGVALSVLDAGGLGGAGKTFLKNILKKGGKSAIKKIAKADDPEVIKEILETQRAVIPDEYINLLAKEKNPEAVRAIVEAAENKQVISKVDNELVENGLTEANVKTKSRSDIKLGSDAYGKLDPQQVAKYAQEIAAGRPIAPVIVRTTKDGVFVQDGKHRLAALEALGIEDVPTVEQRVKDTAAKTEQSREKIKEVVEQSTPTGEPIPTAASEVEQALQEAPVVTANPESTTAAIKANDVARAADEAQPAGTAVGAVEGATGPKTVAEVKAPDELISSPSAVKRAALSVKGELDQYGPSGQQMGQGLSEARDISEISQAAFMREIPTVTSLGKNDFETFVNSLEALSKGERIDVSENVIQAIDEWVAAIPKVRQAAGEVGLDVGDLGQFYFPRDYSDLLKNTKNDNRLAQELVKSGQAKDLGEAIQTIQFMRRRYDTAFGHFENARVFDLPDYDKSKNALVNYINGAFNKVGEAKVFGPNGEKAQDLISEAANQGADAQRMLDLYQIGIGAKVYDRPVAKSISGGLRAFQRLRALGLSAILNLGQTTNTATSAGVFRTAASIKKLALSPADRDFVQSTGVTSDATLQALREGSGVAGRVTGKLTAPGFNAVERINRSTAAIAGRDLGNDLAARAASGDLKSANLLREELGVTGDIGARLTPEQEIQAGRKLVERTQFKVDPQDLPAWANSPEGKLVAQFRTFAYKQTKFIFDEVIKKAGEGNPLPLMRFLSVGSAIGYLTGNAREFLRGNPVFNQSNEDRPAKNAAEQFVTALGNVGAFGFGSNAIYLFNARNSKRLPGTIAGTIGGPTVGYGASTLFNVAEAAQGKPKNLGRQGLAAVPIVGPALSNQLLPYKPVKGKEKAGQLRLTKRQAGATSNDATVRWDNLTAKAKVNISRNQPEKYIARETDRIDRELASGKITEAQAFKQYRYVQKVSIYSKYDRNTADAYKLNSTNFKAYLKKNTDQEAALRALDSELLAAGLIPYSKFPRAKSTGRSQSRVSGGRSPGRGRGRSGGGDASDNAASRSSYFSALTPGKLDLSSPNVPNTKPKVTPFKLKIPKRPANNKRLRLRV
jgi:hypothetical protein